MEETVAASLANRWIKAYLRKIHKQRATGFLDLSHESHSTSCGFPTHINRSQLGGYRAP